VGFERSGVGSTHLVSISSLPSYFCASDDYFFDLGGVECSSSLGRVFRDTYFYDGDVINDR
jgi:hypothetical protein